MQSEESIQQKSTEPILVDPHLTGAGILSGLETYLDESSRIMLTPGIAITSDGEVIKISEEKHFKFYYTQSDKEEDIIRYFQGFLQENNPNKIEKIYVLDHTNKKYVHGTNDPLIAQYKSDNPDDFFLDDKVLTLVIDKQSHIHFVLLSLKDVVYIQQLENDLKQVVKQQQPTPRPGLFPKGQVIQQNWEEEDIDQLLRKSLQLPQVFIRRFGYQHLALKHKKKSLDFDQPDTPQRLDNLQNPFSKIDSFSDIFFEYKHIIDDGISDLREALDELHQLFGSQLSNQKDAYLERYRRLLVEKWRTFLDRGEYLFYVQYFYDWLIDLTKAYNELIVYFNKNIVIGNSYLTNLGKEEESSANDQAPMFKHIWLGLVSGNYNAFAERVFRDYFKSPAATEGQEEHLRHLRFLHWRLLMMIRTFDLPFLRLEHKVLKRFFPPSVEDRDSSDYWERLNVVVTTEKEEDDKIDIEDLPLKATPTSAGWQPLDSQCIAYYYPLSHSQFSVHRYWNYEKYLLGRIAENNSYNSFKGIKFGAAEKASYTELPAIVYPLAFNLQAFAGFKVEGHIGRKINLFWDEVNKKVIPTNWIYAPPKPIENVTTLYLAHLLNEIRNVFNLKIDVILVDAGYKIAEVKDEKVEIKTKETLGKLIGLERKGWVAPGETLVLVYTLGDPVMTNNIITSYTGEQIELDECTADETPEIRPYTIVADFTLPYLYSCCSKEDVPGITIIPYESGKLDAPGGS